MYYKLKLNKTLTPGVFTLGIGGYVNLWSTKHFYYEESK